MGISSRILVSEICVAFKVQYVFRGKASVECHLSRWAETLFGAV